MMMITEWLFAGAVICIMQHELDAIQQGEWRFFFQRISVSDQTAYRIFTALHVLMFGLILWHYQSLAFRIFLDSFLIFHAGLHWALRNNPHIAFDNWFSWVWILGGAILGGLHLAALYLGI